MSEFLTVEQAHSASDCAVVIDVMRAYTTAAWAFAGGAERIILVKELEEALSIAGATPNALAFRDGPLTEGFALANSPVQVQKLDVAQRTIVQRTSAGTQGAVAARQCEALYCASFVCAQATADHLARTKYENVSFIVTGGDEDLACAELIDALTRDEAVDPAPYLERALQCDAAQRLRAAAARGFAGVDRGDVDACLTLDRFGFAMQARLEDELLVLRPIGALGP
jgi:2-phosphosulfolactate phosphatase